MPSASRGTSYEPPIVDPAGGARSKLTGHRSGGAFRIFGEGERAGGDRETTFTAGEGGYTDEDEDDAEDEDQEVPLMDTEDEDPEINRIDYRSVIDRIRTACNIPATTPEPRRNNKVGYEKKKRPDPAPRTSILLP